jgi:RNA polymerase sigma factor (sigma-70 family)
MTVRIAVAEGRSIQRTVSALLSRIIVMPSHSTWLNQLYRLTCPSPGDAELIGRWVQRRDEDAFTALVSRHGRMVHGVCRRVLGNTHDADDAFQAVFLTLARKADGLRRPEALAGWLHGVAVRLACKARMATSRRRVGDCPACLCDPCDPHPDPLEALSARELMALIDREIARLPEAYRLPLLLCDLEGRTQPEAARLLGWTLGSLRGRLLRGRERLRSRLAKRGIAPAVLAAAFVPSMADAAAPPADIGRLAVRFSTCPAATDIAPSVAALVREGMHGLMLAKLKLASVVLLAVCTLAAGAGLVAWPTPAPQLGEDKPPPTPGSAKPQARLDRAGDPLPAEALSRLGTTRLRHGGHIFSVAFTPDGETLVSEGEDGLRIWEAATGKQIRRVGNGWCGGIETLSISPDGKLVTMLLPAEVSVGLLEIATGRIVQRFSKRRVHSLCFSPDGKMLATLGYPSSEIELWDPATGRVLGSLKGHQNQHWSDEVRSAMFSADGKTLVSGGDDRTIRFWDVASGKEKRLIQTEKGVTKIALSPDGRTLASLGHVKQVDQRRISSQSEAVIHLWDTATGKELRQLTMPAVEVRGEKRGFSTMLFTPDGKALVTGGHDGMVRIWEPTTGKEVRQFRGLEGRPFSLALHPDGKTLAVIDMSATIHLIRLDTGKDSLPLSGHRGGVFSVFLKPDGQSAVTSAGDGLLRLWDARNGALRRDIARRSESLLPILPNGKTYLTSGSDKKLRVCEMDSGKEVQVLEGWNGRPDGFALSPDGRILAQDNADSKKVDLINPATGKILRTLGEFNPSVMHFSFSPDGRNLFVWSLDKTVTVWDANTGEKRRQFSCPVQSKPERMIPGLSPYESFSAKLSPDGRLLAFGLSNLGPKPGVLPVVDTSTGKEVHRFTTGTDGVSALAFSPDGHSLAWGGWREGTVYLGEIATGKERRRFDGHRGRIFSLAFSADGKTLISGSKDTTALIWDLSGRLAMGTTFGKSLSAEELQTHWKTLADDDAAAGFRAMQALAADPTHSIPYLRKRLHAVAPVDEKRLQQWIADLDNEKFAVREKAASELEKHGWAALPAMRKALEGKPALETRRRLEPLIEKQQREERAPSAEELRVRRALEVMELSGTPEAKEVLTILANGAARARQTRDAKSALQRLDKRP